MLSFGSRRVLMVEAWTGEFRQIASGLPPRMYQHGSRGRAIVLCNPPPSTCKLLPASAQLMRRHLESIRAAQNPQSKPAAKKTAKVPQG
jgi:hypothetical protein